MLETLEKLLSESPGTALCIVFWVGTVASLSWCTAIGLPIVVTYVAGFGESKKRMLLLTVLFLLGFVISYVLLGVKVASTAEAAQAVVHTNKLMFWALGALLFLAGIAASGMISSHLLPQRWQRIGGRLGWIDVPGALLVGALFGLLTMPACPACGAGLISLARLTVVQSLSPFGLAVFVSFGLGQGLPILAVGVLTTILKQDLTQRLRTRMCSIEQKTQLLCGNALMILGIYFVVVG